VIAYKMRNAVKRHVQRIHIEYLGKLRTHRSRVRAYFSGNIHFFSLSELPEKRTAFDKVTQTVFPNAVRQTIEAADKYCEHTFDLLGSGPTFLGSEIDWH